MCVMPEAQVDQAHPSHPTSRRSRAGFRMFKECVNVRVRIGVRIRNTFDLHALRWLFMFLTFSDNKSSKQKLF
jgi:hypothetical protein